MSKKSVVPGMLRRRKGRLEKIFVATDAKLQLNPIAICDRFGSGVFSRSSQHAAIDLHDPCGCGVEWMNSHQSLCCSHFAQLFQRQLQRLLAITTLRGTDVVTDVSAILSGQLDHVGKPLPELASTDFIGTTVTGPQE
jgi:hypothetical protein